MPDCELVGTEIRQVVAVRDRRGNAYVAFAHTTVDRTVSGSFDQAIYFCNYNPSRDDSVTELRVLRVDNGAAEARAVLTLPVPRLASLRLASFEDDFAIAFSSVDFRVARFRVENLP